MYYAKLCLMRKRDGKTISCFTCKKVFYIPKNMFKTRRFCSHKCYSLWKKGNPIFKVWLGKIRPSFSGENNPMKRPEVRKKISDAMKGRKLTEAHKKKLSLAKIGLYSGNKHWNWQGGISHTPHYKTIRFSPGFYVYEHRLIAEKMLGRKLERGEVVHHIDFNSFNNNPDNLRVMKHRDHIILHKARAKEKRDAHLS
jgi:hypothetical protein